MRPCPQELPFADWEEASRKIREDTRKAEELLKQISLAQKERESADQAVVSLESDLKVRKENLETLSAGLPEADPGTDGIIKRPDIDALAENVSRREKETETLEDTVSGIRNRIGKNRDRLDRIGEQVPALLKARDDRTISERLYKLVSGNTGNGKLTLEQYVQAEGFDNIIRAANRRLLPMSDGRFELFRQEGTLGRRSNTFLDLEVLDHYTGHRRPVGRLSGGESFKASLSLALGLSDTVSSDRGGIQMDAHLGIDKGCHEV